MDEIQPHTSPLATSPAYNQPPNVVIPTVVTTPYTPPTVETVKADPKVAKVDHLSMIEGLIAGLHNISPSGAETIRDKIMLHIGALRDPKAYDERIAREKKASDELEAANAKDRSVNKRKPDQDPNYRTASGHNPNQPEKAKLA